MKRIGVAASRMSKGNLAFYNFYVVLISFLLSFFVFIFVGSMMIFSLIILNYVGKELGFPNLLENKSFIIKLLIILLSIIMGVFNLLAIVRNLKVYRRRK